MKPFLLVLIMIPGAMPQSAANDPPQYVLAIHGGAGRVSETDEIRQRRSDVLEKVLSHGEALLKKGKSSLHVVEEVIRMLEDAPEFNAGRGSVFNATGGHELDASIMDGCNRACGAVAGVTTVRHPITLARHVMTETRHVLLANTGAEQFADELGDEQIERVTNHWFSTNQQRQNLKKAQAAAVLPEIDRIGTVGCVARDKAGNIAAGTSTGGLTNKKFGRIGDSPIVGAGTFADNSTCGIRCTGIGEDFIRNSVAFSISAQLQYGNAALHDAVAGMLQDTTHPIKGGLIAISADGEIVMQYNTPGMSRASANANGHREVHVD